MSEPSLGTLRTSFPGVEFDRTRDPWSEGEVLTAIFPDGERKKRRMHEVEIICSDNFPALVASKAEEMVMEWIG